MYILHTFSVYLNYHNKIATITERVVMSHLLRMGSNYKHKQLTFYHRTSLQSIFVYDNKQYRWLTFDNEFIQTIINKQKPYLPMLKYLPHQCVNLSLAENKHDSVLLLGAGGGAHLHYLAQYAPNCSIELVEINPVIVDIAQRYFGIKQKINLSDAYNYIKHSIKHDHILIDIFINKFIPEHILLSDFLYKCHEKSNKVISINLVSVNQKQTFNVLQVIRSFFYNRTLCLIVNKQSNIIIHIYKESKHLADVNKLWLQQRITKPIWQEPYGLVAQIKNL